MNKSKVLVDFVLRKGQKIFFLSPIIPGHPVAYRAAFFFF